VLSDHDEAFAIEIDPSSLSYLLYTSGLFSVCLPLATIDLPRIGTTGTPKGCLLTHRGLHAAICSMGSHCENVTDQDKWLGLACEIIPDLENDYSLRF
jgi:acyl-CoA synthetase (AMP-forming)/AMP-acid ligase II